MHQKPPPQWHLITVDEKMRFFVEVVNYNSTTVQFKTIVAAKETCG